MPDSPIYYQQGKFELIYAKNGQIRLKLKDLGACQSEIYGSDVSNPRARPNFGLVLNPLQFQKLQLFL